MITADGPGARRPEPSGLVRVAVAVILFGIALATAACTGGGAEGGQGGVIEDEQATAEEGGGSTAFGSVEFVTAALEGSAAASFFATDPLDDADQGAPFDRAILEGRLSDLAALAVDGSSVRPSAEASFPTGDGLGPACARSSGLLCEVDVIGPADSVVASVIVYWFGDGVTDFSILPRGDGGAYEGVGEASCSPGFELVHGGSSDRFDIAVCVDASGEVEYNGADRDREVGIRLEGCRADEIRWEARNVGFLYVVEEAGRPIGSRIEVLNPSGETVEDGLFTTVRREPPATPEAC